MRWVLLSSAGLFFLILAFGASAQAEELRKNETYCLEKSLGPDDGGTILECDYETWDQCMASRVQGDTCMLNPRLAYERQKTRTRP